MARTDLVAALADSEVAVVQAALDQLATLAIAASTPGTNAMPALLGIAVQADEDEGEDDDDEDGDDDDDGDAGEDGDDEDDGDDEADEGDDDGGATIQARARGALPPIDDALDQHLAQIAPATLAHLFAALFHDGRDNFPAAARIAAEVARRGDDAAQLALIEAFIAAKPHHDNGHDTDDSVRDVVIDDVFPTLGAPALTRLLAWSTHGRIADPDGEQVFTWDLVAFNLACHAARAGDRAAMLRHTRRALELGNRPDQFLRDAAFTPFLRDPELLALLDARR